ncbi:hypothetical protein Tco_0852442 [Tanacetum coccineum]
MVENQLIVQKQIDLQKQVVELENVLEPDLEDDLPEVADPEVVVEKITGDNSQNMSKEVPNQVQREVKEMALKDKNLASLNQLLQPWDVSQHMEFAAALAMELSVWNKVAAFYKTATDLYNECGSP